MENNQIEKKKINKGLKLDGGASLDFTILSKLTGCDRWFLFIISYRDYYLSTLCGTGTDQLIFEIGFICDNSRAIEYAN